MSQRFCSDILGLEKSFNAGYFIEIIGSYSRNAVFEATEFEGLVQLESELIELEFIDGLDNLGFLSLVLSLSGSLSLSFSFGLSGFLGGFSFGLSGFLHSFSFGLSGFLDSFSFGLSGFFLGTLGDFFRLAFLFLGGRVGSGSASVASSSSFRTLVVEEVLNALRFDLEAHFLSEFRKLVGIDVLRL